MHLGMASASNIVLGSVIGRMIRTLGDNNHFEERMDDY